MDAMRNTKHVGLVAGCSSKQIGRWLSAGAVLAAIGLSPAMSLGQVSNGADVIVGDLPDVTNYTPAATDAGFDAFAIGTTSCNRGNTPLLWFTGGTDNRHPTIGQNLYRLHNGRFEMIGQAWLKHGFTALQGSICAGSAGFPHASCAATAGTTLGVGCSDPYSSGLNGSQSGLGPKWQVNAATGIAPYPYAGSPGTGATSGRLRVRTADLDPATYAGALYFVEGQYISPDDSDFNNKNNNASYRQVSITQVAAAGAVPAHVTMSYVVQGSPTVTVRELPAVRAWQTADPTVQIATADIAGDGQFLLACKVTGPVSGLYTYEYYLHNLNSDRCAGSFSVPYPSGTTTSAIGFKDVEYHSGEPNAVNPANPASDDWTNSAGATALTWAGPNFAGTVASYTLDPAVAYKVLANPSVQWVAGTGNNHTANVLRWGTGFNFRFQTSVAPAQGQIQIGLWRPGTPSTITMAIRTPGGASTGTPSTAPCCVGQACTVTTQAACTGTFGTIGATCAGSPCPLPTGACCSVDGVCVTATTATCTGASTYRGDGTLCAPNPCPQPTGACCSATGTCSVTTQAACVGSYAGNGLACSPTTCANNDLCAGAIPLCDGVSVNGNNTTAGTDGTASCVGSKADLWYRYIPATTGPVTVETLGGGTLSDTVLSIQTACGGASVVCDDDGGPGNLSLISNFQMTAGTQYLIRVATWINATNGTFTVRVTGGGGLGCQAVATGSCCVTTNCSVVTQAVCTTNAGTWTTGGTCSPNLCDPSGACCHAGSCTVINRAACPTTGSSFTVAGTCAPSICPPLNDDCANRVGTPLGATPFDSTYATTDGPLHNPACNFVGNQIHKDMWYNHPSQITGKLRISTCGSTFDTAIAVYNGFGCVNYDTRLMACNDDNATICGAGSLQSSVDIDVVAGTSYTIRVGGYAATLGGLGTLTITNITSGACCVGTSCSVGLQTACTGAFQGSASVCGVSPNPTTCCRANFNGNGGVSVQDIFDFLSAWFSGAPAADFNGVNGVTVQDIFDFLAAWFQGC